MEKAKSGDYREWECFAIAVAGKRMLQKWEIFACQKNSCTRKICFEKFVILLMTTTKDIRSRMQLTTDDIAEKEEERKMANVQIVAQERQHKEHIQDDIYDEWSETRYVIVDSESGEVLDDAQGYGYKTRQKAWAAWNYKHRDTSHDKEKAEKERIIATWMKEHKSFVAGMDQIAFEIAKGSWGPDDKFDTAMVKQMLKDSGYEDLPFTAYELLRYWQNGPRYTKKKR